MRDHAGPCGIMRDDLDHSGPCGTMLDHMGLYGTIIGYMGPYKRGLFGAMWDHMGPYRNSCFFGGETAQKRKGGHRTYLLDEGTIGVGSPHNIGWKSLAVGG